ncbi:MAG: DNA-binding domain-containing protein [Dokdonella sp.]
MTSLRELQTRFKAHLLEGDTAIAQSVTSLSAEDSEERLGIYGFGYGQRLREALRIEFPGLATLAGEAAFNELLDRYTRACPSRHPNVRWLGREMVAWLARDNEYSSRPELAAMASLDWALSTSFDAPDVVSIDSSTMASLAPELWPGVRFIIHPAVQVMPLRWNVDAIRLAIGDEDNPAPPLESMDEGELVVWRKDFGVRYRRLDTDESAALAAVRANRTFGEVCEVLCEWHTDGAVAARAVFLLQRWFAAGWISGIQCAELENGPALLER